MAAQGNKFGLDAELAQKMADKYDKGLEERVQVWLEAVTGITFDKEFGEMMKDGIVLCQLVNTIMPGRIKKINKTGGLFKLQENITNFIRVCREIGVPESSLFPTESLAQLKDLNQVLTTLNAFSTQIQRRRNELGISFDGPFLGPPLKKKAPTGLGGGAPVSAGGSTKKASKWVVKPGGSSGQTLMGQGSAAVMEATKYTNARDMIKENKLDGTGTNGAVSKWNTGSAEVMERSGHTDAREMIKENKLHGEGTRGAVSALNQGSVGMERSAHTDVREDIKRGKQ